LAAGSAAGGGLRPLILAHRSRQQHVGAFLPRLQREVLMGVFGQHDRGKRTEALMELHLPVDLFLHSGVPGVAEDAATAQRPRAELHPPLVPADHLALCEGGGDLPA